jgi:uncharacterized protein YdeI (YjbR/CyaY-like superfamily)
LATARGVDRAEPGQDIASPAHDQWLLDEALAETFPASDPISPSSASASPGIRRVAKKTNRALPVLAFADREAFDAWLSAQPPDSDGLWLKMAKKGAGQASLSKQGAIDVALCRGWIDGQLATHDAQSWLIRFTPRKPGSRWSQINARRAIALVEEGRMHAGGLAQVQSAKADGRFAAAYAPATSAPVPADLQTALAANPAAAAFFRTLKGANRYAVLYRIGAVKKPETRARKIDQFVAMLARGETLHG